jgi:hypothetical protein
MARLTLYDILLADRYDGVMRRYHAEMPIMRRQLSEGMGLGKSLPAGYYRKRDAHDCGRARCGVCHPHKRFGHTLTRQEIAAGLRLKEQTTE